MVVAVAVAVAVAVLVVVLVVVVVVVIVVIVVSTFNLVTQAVVVYGSWLKRLSAYFSDCEITI